MVSRAFAFGLWLSLACSGAAHAISDGIGPGQNTPADKSVSRSVMPHFAQTAATKSSQSPQGPSRAGNAGNVSTAPLKWVGMLYGEMKSGGFDCTGQFVAPRVVLTAAHCVQNNLTGEWYDTTKMRFWLQYQNKNFSHQYRVICSARLDGWIPTVSRNATDQDKFVAIQDAFAYDFAMLLVDGDSVTGTFKVALDAAGTYGTAEQVGYPAAIDSGKYAQQDEGFLGQRFFPPNVLALWHSNEKMTEGTSGGAWVANPSSTEGPQNNLLVGITSFGNPTLWPRTTFGPYLKSNDYAKLLNFVSNGCR
jgi:Trypsin